MPFERDNPDSPPTPEQLTEFIKTPLWTELCGWLEQLFHVKPTYDFSRCGLEHGWNIKYKKSGRSLCTLDPREGGFCAMVSIGPREQPETERLLPGCTPYVQELYRSTSDSIGSKWLMLEVTSPEILEDVRQLICIRASRKK